MTSSAFSNLKKLSMVVIVAISLQEKGKAVATGRLRSNPVPITLSCSFSRTALSDAGPDHLLRGGAASGRWRRGLGRPWPSYYEDLSTHWPDFRDDMPVRPAVVAITRQGCGRIG